MYDDFSFESAGEDYPNILAVVVHRVCAMAVFELEPGASLDGAASAALAHRCPAGET